MWTATLIKSLFCHVVPFLTKTLKPDSIDLLFLGSSCTLMKWETANNLKKNRFCFLKLLYFHANFGVVFLLVLVLSLLTLFKWVRERSEKQQIDWVWPHHNTYKTLHLWKKGVLQTKHEWNTFTICKIQESTNKVFIWTIKNRHTSCE